MVLATWLERLLWQSLSESVLVECKSPPEVLRLPLEVLRFALVLLRRLSCLRLKRFAVQ